MTTLPLFSVPVDRTDTDERFTPRWVFDALGERFDLDPASPVDAETNVPADARYTRDDDGLAQPWHGFVWCNPPYSNSTPWADRFLEHRDGIWLGPFANAKWLQRMLREADAIWLMRDFAFEHPTHAGKRSSMPLAMFGLGPRAAGAIERAARFLPGAGVLVARPTDRCAFTVDFYECSRPVNHEGEHRAHVSHDIERAYTVLESEGRES